jgi:hypothetical protein
MAKKKAQEKPKLLVLDEINLALDCKLLNVNEVIVFLKSVPKETNVVLTGRRAPKELLLRFRERSHRYKTPRRNTDYTRHPILKRFNEKFDINSQ